MTNMFDTAPQGGRAAFTYAGYDEAPRDDLTSDHLEGASVHGHDDDSIGSISDLVLGDDGKISKAIIDVGGFLGIGARSVAIPFHDLTVLRETGGRDLRVYVAATKSQLESMPPYKG